MKKRKAQAKLSARRKSFEGMKATQGYKRPGSMSGRK